MDECTATALGPLCCVAAGIALLWLRSWIYRRDPTGQSDLLVNLLTVSGAVLLLIGVYAVVAVMTQAFFLLAWLAVAVVLAAARLRYRDAERQSLLWVLMAAAERGIPLDAAAQAFADERSDALGIRARNLADYLEAGLPLALALKRSRNTVPTAAMLAADLGEQTGTLGPALRQAIGQADPLERTLRSILEKFFYVVFMALFIAGALTFLLIKIIPMFRRILEEHDMELPAATETLIAASRGFGLEWFGYFLLLAALLIVLVVAVLYYVCLSPRDLPVVRGLWARADGALVLRWLAIAVRQKRPISEYIRLLSAYYPRATLRRRLERAAKRTDKGADWCESLLRVGVIRRPESLVFQAAERTGNLEWALDEMADSSLRRTAYRLQALHNILFPAAVIAIGSIVFFVALAILLPLFSLIQWMT
jgi:type II secretory pathway component PulF